jgi:hypothetical protein
VTNKYDSVRNVNAEFNIDWSRETDSNMKVHVGEILARFPKLHGCSGEFLQNPASGSNRDGQNAALSGDIKLVTKTLDDIAGLRYLEVRKRHRAYPFRYFFSYSSITSSSGWPLGP